MSLRGIARMLAAVAVTGAAASVGVWMGTTPHRIRAAMRDAQMNVEAGHSKTPILVELFTSEGCSSCPPADALLGQLDREQPVPNGKIIVLSEHVDYWNHGGWQDRFSSSELTDRQKDYADLFKLDDVYTPQMVVNGAAQMNGTDVRSIQSALEKAAASHPIPLEITSVRVQGKGVTFTLRGGMPATPGYVDIYAALVDPEDSTVVRAGENGGRTLEHFGVVRKWSRIGASWRTQALGEKPLGFNGEIPGKATLNGMRFVVFVQKKHVGPVLGVDACVITAEKTDSGALSPCPTSGS